MLVSLVALNTKFRKYKPQSACSAWCTVRYCWRTSCQTLGDQMGLPTDSKKVMTNCSRCPQGHHYFFDRIKRGADYWLYLYPPVIVHPTWKLLHSLLNASAKLTVSSTRQVRSKHLGTSHGTWSLTGYVSEPIVIWPLRHNARLPMNIIKVRANCFRGSLSADYLFA
jgi:hypothetical protein